MTRSTTAVPERVAATAISTPLHDARTLSRTLVTHFAEHVAPCGTLPGDALRGDVTAVTRTCLELAAAVLEGRDGGAKLERLRRAGADWAREGIPIGTIHRAVHDGFALGFDLIVDSAGPEQYDRIAETARRLMEVQAMVGTAFAVAYVREHRAVAAEHHSAVHTVTSALLAGHSAATMARAGGVEIDEAYHVLALGIPAHVGESDPATDPKVVARRKLRRLQSELADRCAGRALALLGTDGGTVLLPQSAIVAADLESLVLALSVAAQVPITAIALHTATAAIPAAADQGHELLDLVHRLGCAPGLYNFDDLAMEYQLTRPGPGREYLGALLDPLDEHPELLETLRRHIANDLNRKRTARVLGVHANTVDYRLKRIALLTGFDPAQSSGLWYLRSALVARSYDRPGAGDPPPSASASRRRPDAPPAPAGSAPPTTPSESRPGPADDARSGPPANRT
ncbi:helix-turn-helix domain-containing protein [Nocardia sp. NPDC005978]|uniref:PucR family transcriptional regulator n=1 Tax=unclassified Nocardia TaxID=2637762 RepID=UPI0033A8F886